MQAAQFKENTGFCVLCREWKLLMIDGYQQGGIRSKKTSSYCIRCSQNMKEAADKARKSTDDTVFMSRHFPGHEARIQAHIRRVQKAGAA